MKDEELSRALRDREPLPPAHRERLEQELLAAYDARMGRRAPRRGAPWLRFAATAGVLLCLVSASQVTAEYKVEVGKRLRLVLPAGQEPPPGLGDMVTRAFTSDPAHPLEVRVLMRPTPEGPMTLVVDIWGDRLTPDSEGLERLRAMPEFAGLPVEVTSLQGRVRDNLIGVMRHSLFRAGASPEEREQARRRLVEELRRLEGEGVEIDVDVEEDAQNSRMRVRVRKQLSQPPSE